MIAPNVIPGAKAGAERRRRQRWIGPALMAQVGLLVVAAISPRTDAVTDVYLGLCATVALISACALFRRRAEVVMHTLVADLESRNAELEQAHTEADEARRTAEDAVRVKGEFLANMSHELRTPMTAILGFADVLQNGGASEAERTDYIRTIQRSGEHLLALINDILDFSKIEAGRMTVETVTTSPLHVLSDAVAMLRDRAESKGVRLETSCEGPVPVSIRSDPTRLRQILINLIGNAIKFTDVGSVSVRVKLLGTADSQRPQLCFEVLDTGIGIAPDVRARLFQPFMQADGSMTRRFGGTGLGLAICRRLSNLLGGDVSVESDLGRGSTFRVTLDTGSLKGVPVVSGLDALAARKATSSVAKLSGRVLLADDGPDNQRLIAFHLRHVGLDVEVVSNGLAAVEQVLRAERGSRPFALVLMDMQMPEMDGYQATATLRARGWRGAIVALTAQSTPGDRERSIAAGCDDFATKPIDRDLLIDSCRSWLQRGATRHDAERDKAA